MSLNELDIFGYYMLHSPSTESLFLKYRIIVSMVYIGCYLYILGYSYSEGPVFEPGYLS